MRTITFLMILLTLAACATHRSAPDASINRKSAPYDHVTFQRTYPDRDFDWRGWRQTLRRADAEAGAQARGLSDCNPSAQPTAWTLQGPANVAGRVNSLAVQPTNDSVVLAGFAGGGIFKSTDLGQTWRPVFDDFGNLSIGDLRFDPSNPQVVYAGTGDANMPIMLYNGDGLYRSTDAGDTWQYVGLSEVGIISHIVVHPTNPQVLWVGAAGNPYTRNNQRGVYRSTDGGNTWQQVLFVSNQAGCSGLVQSPANPDVLYASFWDRIRNNSESIVYGPNAKVFKSTDGGSTWAQLGGGLPTGNWGRTGLAVSATNPDKVYALYIDSLSTPGQLLRSTDGGQSWEQLAIGQLEDACADFGWYFGKLSLSPTNDDDLYFHAILLYRRLTNGGWQVASGGHADSHDLVFCASGRRYWANDGGVYRNEPSGNGMWIKSNNLPATQVYRTSYDPHQTARYWLGAQDNGIKFGNATNLNSWGSAYSADGFRCIFDPTDPNYLAVETQNGAVHVSTNGGQTFTTGSVAFGTGDRCNWDAPLLRSQHPPYPVYAGTYRVLTGGTPNSWSPISPDLTDGVVIAPRFHTISALGESPLVAGRILVGTSDANVWRNGGPPGTPWVNITANLPQRYVTSVTGSPSVANRIFVTHSGFRDNEYLPHIHRSDDNGTTWQDISGNLPQVPVNQLFVLPNHADSVLCAATDAGVYFSRNGGQAWARLGRGMPSVPAFDFAHNLVRRELVAGTFGRGVWTFPLDSIMAQPGEIAPIVGVAGQVQTEADAPIARVEVPFFGGLESDTTGQIRLPPLPRCDSVFVVPRRADDPLNGVTTYDLVLISRHILGLEPLGSPYRMIAADANRSNTVTSFDIVLLRRLILGIDSTLVGGMPWRFVPSSHVFPNPANPFTAPIPESVAFLPHASVPPLDFVGIKIGDLNASASTQLDVADERTADTWPIEVQDVDFQRDSTHDVIFYLKKNALSAGQFTLRWDADRLEWEGLECLDGQVSADKNFDLRGAERGVVTFAFENAAAASGDATDQAEPMFAIRWRAKSAGRLSAHLRVADAPTRALAYPAGDAQARRMVLRFSDRAATGPTVWPNPFGSGGCRIRLVADAEVRVLDWSGQVLTTRQGRSGEVLTLAADLFGAAGTYILEVRGTDGHFFIQRVVFLGKK
jgi:photosystem II stability/assembly factor-like uncharacterized protein